MPHTGKLKKLPHDLAGLIPSYGPDPRQEGLLGSLKKDEELVANLHQGFPASHVNMEFIQWLVSVVHQRGMEIRDAMKAVVGYGVQHVESMSVTARKDDENIYDIRFMAYDDCGRYGYVLEVNIKKDYPVPSLVYRQVALAEEEDIEE